jgi:glucan phosphorylase
LKLVFIPNYNVSIAELIIPALDVFQSISAPGTPCQYSTAPMKALMNGCLILGSRLSSNMDLERVYHKAKEPKIYEYELKEEVEDMPIVIFGLTKDQL